MITFTNEDCREMMSRYPDKHFDLAIVDPPYFDGPQKLGFYGAGYSSIGVKRLEYKKIGTWTIPDISYYNELVRVSKHQIIWGINYFDFPVGPGRIIWDKCNDSSSFSDAEIASCSLIDTVRIFRFMWSGMLQGRSIKNGHIMQGDKSKNEKRIHPTQKPVKLYEWCLNEFAKEGDKIVDTHHGSASLSIACEELGFSIVATEIDPEHYSNALNRIDTYQSHLKLRF